MNIIHMEQISRDFIEKVNKAVSKEGMILTELSFVKAGSDAIHVQIGACRKDDDEDGHVFWWVCALPLNVSPNIMVGKRERSSVR